MFCYTFFGVDSHVFFVVKKQTEYEMRISVWSSDVCSSDLLDSLLAQALMSIQAVKGVEIGDGFDVAGRRGSEAHDPIAWDAEARTEQRTVGTACVRTCRSRWSPYHSTKKQLKIV